LFAERMAVYELPVIDFSILLITHNPGIPPAGTVVKTSRP
jgi:hypothetical protein